MKNWPGLTAKPKPPPTLSALPISMSACWTRRQVAPGARAARLLAGLGFDEAAQQLPCHSFSGGWRMRVGLAALLFTEPDLLLLDEPTNHLDLEASLWLESYLRNYPGTVLLVSHDRDLLNRVAEEILHLGKRQADPLFRQL